MKKLDSVLDLIGNTPAKRLDSIGEPFHVSLWAKLENLNPSGSIKDRIALQMVEDAEKSGNLKKGFTIIESSSGNTAIALSFVGGLKGYKRIIFMPNHGQRKSGDDQKVRLGNQAGRCRGRG